MQSLLIAILLTAGFSFLSNQQRERMEMSVSRHFEMVENLVDLQTQLLSADAALRGYLLNHDPATLQPYREASEIVPQKLARVADLIATIPKLNRRQEKMSRFAAVRANVETQLKALEGADGIKDQALIQTATQQLAPLRADEQQRLEEIRSVRQRDFLLIFLSVAVGFASRAIALYFFHRRVVRRVRQLTENARSLRDGSPLVHEPSGQGDDIGDLEQELARIGDYLAARR